MKRFFCAAVLLLLVFPLLLALASLGRVLRGLEAVMAWLADLATPLILNMAEIAEGDD